MFLSSALSLFNIYVCTKFNFNPFVLSKIWPRHTSIMTNTKLRGDNSINIHGMIIAIGFRPSFHCHLSINQVLFQSMLYFPKYGPDRQHLWKMYRVWLWFVGSALPLIAIYLNTKFDLNGNSSFKVIGRTRYQDGRKDGRTKRWIYASLFG